MASQLPSTRGRVSLPSPLWNRQLRGNDQVRMGLDINSVNFLIAARKAGVECGDVLTLGRQDLNVFPAKMVQVLGAHGFPAGAFQAGNGDTLFADAVFQALGARKVSALDFSDFEGAEFVHDLNQPIGPELRERFDLVYDGGTLEHVFQFPLALRNCLEMVRVGGRFFMHTCANNWCGHGFYQFSPELFYTALSEENGFEVESMILHRVGPYGRWFEVSDPRKIRSRVELVSFAPVQLLIRARRTRVMPIFARAPQQSDYTVRWDDPSQPGSKAKPFTAARPRLARMLPGVARLMNVAKAAFVLVRTQTLWNRRNFRPVKRS